MKTYSELMMEMQLLPYSKDVLELQKESMEFELMESYLDNQLYLREYLNIDNSGSIYKVIEKETAGSFKSLLQKIFKFFMKILRMIRNALDVLINWIDRNFNPSTMRRMNAEANHACNAAFNALHHIVKSGANKLANAINNESVLIESASEKFDKIINLYLDKINITDNELRIRLAKMMKNAFHRIIKFRNTKFGSKDKFLKDAIRNKNIKVFINDKYDITKSMSLLFDKSKNISIFETIEFYTTFQSIFEELFNGKKVTLNIKFDATILEKMPILPIRQFSKIFDNLKKTAKWFEDEELMYYMKTLLENSGVNSQKNIIDGIFITLISIYLSDIMYHTAMGDNRNNQFYSLEINSDEIESDLRQKMLNIEQILNNYREEIQRYLGIYNFNNDKKYSSIIKEINNANTYLEKKLKISKNILPMIIRNNKIDVKFLSDQLSQWYIISANVVTMIDFGLKILSLFSTLAYDTEITMLENIKE